MKTHPRLKESNEFCELMYRGSPLSTIFGTQEKSYYAKFVLVCTTQPISTSTNFTTQKFHQYKFYTYSTKIRTSGIRTSGDRTSGGPPVVRMYQKVPKFDFQSQFSMSKITQYFSIFLLLKNTNLGAHFQLLTFFDKIIF